MKKNGKNGQRPKTDGPSQCPLETALRKHVSVALKPNILDWFRDAAHVRVTGRELERNIKTRLHDNDRKKKIISDFLALLDQSTSVANAVAGRQMLLPGGAISYELNIGQVANLKDRLSSCVRNYESDPEFLKLFYQVKVGQGRKVTDARRELDALLSDLVGMWQREKRLGDGYFPAIQHDQGCKAATADDEGKLLRQPFVAMVCDILIAMGRPELIDHVEQVGRIVVKKLKDHWLSDDDEGPDETLGTTSTTT